MKTHLYTSMAALTLGLVASIPSVASAERDDPIDRVVVYGDRAQITRKTTVRCEQGEARARFGPLPRRLVERTLRGDAAGGATAVGVVSRIIEHGPERDERLAPLEAELEALDDTLEALDLREQTIDAAEGDAQRFVAFFGVTTAREARDGKPPVDRWRQALDAFRRAALERVDTRRAIIIERRDVQRQRALVQRRFDALAGLGAEEAWQAEVAVDCGKVGRAVVTLSYVVPDATWRPEYDLRFGADVGQGRVTLGIGAAVQQATGEDWKGATLVLSSARPWLGVEAPTPAPLRIGARKTKEGKVLVQARERRRTLDRDGLSQASGGEPAGAALDDKGQSVTWTLPNRVDIRSDGRPYWVPIDRIRASGEARYVAVPKRSGHVYRLVRFDNPARYPLLAGRLHTWRGGSYVGTQDLEHTGPGAPIEASLGIDGSLRIERVVVDDRTREPGFLSSTRTLPRAFAFVIRSSARAAATVEIRENLPVSKVDDVKVRIDAKKTTAGYDFSPLTGLVTWQAKVPAGGEATVKLGYTIALPEDWKM